MGNCCSFPKDEETNKAEISMLQDSDPVPDKYEQDKLDIANEEEPNPIIAATELKRKVSDRYLELPGPVVREKILSFLTNPEDLLNLLEAYPTEEQFSNWTKAELQFELNFPEMLRGGDLTWDGEHALRRLSFLGDHHRKVILQHYENFLVNDITNQREDRRHTEHKLELSDNFLHPTEEEIPLQQWLKFPVTRQVVICFPLTPDELKKLDKMGGALWDAAIYANPLSQQSNRISLRCLKFLPNLRNLYIVDSDYNSDSDEEMDDDEENAGPVQLPELPSLKSFKFWFDNSITDFLSIWGQFLVKYGPQLNQLSFTVDYPLPVFPQGYFPYSFEKLTVLTFRDKRAVDEAMWDSMEMVTRFMSTLRGAPLKQLKLELDGERVASAIYRLLDYLSQSYGNTLTSFELEFNEFARLKRDRYNPFASSVRRDVETSAELLSSLITVRFPRLTHFGTNMNPLPDDGWEFLLVFPALETLEVRNLWSCGAGGEFRGISEELWKLLPKLKWLRYWKTQEKVTREQVLGKA